MIKNQVYGKQPFHESVDMRIASPTTTMSCILNQWILSMGKTAPYIGHKIRANMNSYTTSQGVVSQTEFSIILFTSYKAPLLR